MAEQNAILAKAEEEFRSSVEGELRRCEEGSRQMQQRFQERKRRLVDNFLKTTAELDWVPEQRAKKLEELKTWASARLEEKVKTKQKEEEYAERSEQQVRLSKAAEDFRSGVESELARNRETSTSILRQTFHQEKERVIRIFRNSTDGLHRISQLREAELEKLKNWAENKIEEKVQAAEKEKRLWEKEQKLSRERAMVKALEQSLSVQGGHSSTCYSPPASPSSYSPATPPSPSGLKFYKGGQFTPGGGRSPKGGCYMPPNSGFSSRSSGSSTMSSRSSSSGGGTFYKGGQFTPGGGRAPKGGCRK